mmetsp:Transcript_19537/g.62203  ORF Transcript_19537/g.62203 Transcript_19537/m.62203 type:complete len:628 (+) Transcript_19537:217-2100(+)
MSVIAPLGGIARGTGRTRPLQASGSAFFGGRAQFVGPCVIVGARAARSARLITVGKDKKKGKDKKARAAVKEGQADGTEALTETPETGALGANAFRTFEDWRPQDEAVLDLPPSEAIEDSIEHVFGYPRDLHARFEVGEPLGAGSFGVVCRAKDRRTGYDYAVKSIPKKSKKGATTSKYLKKLQKEVDVMNRLGRSLNAVFFYGAFEDETHIHIVMEWCKGGELWDRVNEGHYSEAWAATMVRSMLRMVAQCHSHNIMYRDVKPDNFLFLSDHDISPLKATDFGLATHFTPGEKLTQRCGTPAYMAPELILQGYDERADVWSVGMVAFQLLTGRFPFWKDVQRHTLREVWRAILYDDIPFEGEMWEGVSEGARDLCRCLLDRNVASRMTAAEALCHPWVVEGGTAPSKPLSGSIVQRVQRYGTYGVLKQTVLRVIVENYINLEESEQGSEAGHLRELQTLFTSLDVNKQGHLSFDDLFQGLRQAGYHLTDNEVEHLKSTMDVDMDGTINYPEFVASLIDWHAVQGNSHWNEWTKAAFDMLDRDQDGQIDMEEIVAFLPKEASGWRHMEARQLLREADQDGDGKIDLFEFMGVMRAGSFDSLDQYATRLTVDEGSLDDWTDMDSAGEK